MKKEFIIIIASFMFGVLVWVSDSVLDRLFFYEGSFSDLLFLDVPKHEIYFRSLVIIFFIIFGLITSHLFSKRNQAAKTLQASEERYRILLETIPHGIQEIDDSGVIMFCNSAFSKMLGYTMGELIGKSFYSLMPSEAEKTKIQEYLRYLVKEQPPQTPYYNQNLTKDGTLVDLQIDWNYKRNEQGKIVGFISIITDITERKQAEEALRQEKNRAQKLLDIAGVIFVAIDTKGEVTLVNQKGSTVLGYEQKEIIGKNWFGNFLPGSIKDQTRMVFKWSRNIREDNSAST